MAIVTITVDTEENTVAASIDGKEVADVSSASVYKYNDYYNKNKPKVSWNISANNATGDDDFSSYTNYCSATASVSNTGKVEIVMNGVELVNRLKAGLKEEVISKAKADISDYFEKRRNR